MRNFHTMELDPRLRGDSGNGEQQIQQQPNKAPDAYPSASQAAATSTLYALDPALSQQLSEAAAQDHEHLQQVAQSGLPYYEAKRDSVQGIQQLAQHAHLHAAIDFPPKRPRACEACRGLKVRCDFPEEANTCKRCAKANRECIVTAPNRRRPKKTDTRVADLERRIDDLTASLEAQRRQSAGVSQEPETGEETVYNDYTALQPTDHSRKKQKLGHERDAHSLDNLGSAAGGFDSGNAGFVAPLPPPIHNAPFISREYSDIIDRGTLTNADAMQIFDHYKMNMQKQLPCVVFPASTTAGELRKTKPILFLAVLSVASGQDFPDTQKVLNREMARSLADNIILKREKSLELIQALQVVTGWHSSEDSDDTMGFQYIQMANAMAIAMGLSGPQTKSGESKHDVIMPLASDDMEKRRAWLSCYLLSGITSFPLRQLNSVRWSAWLVNCMQALQLSSPDVVGHGAFSDMVLCKWVELQRLCDKMLELALREPLNDAVFASWDDLQVVIKELEEFTNGIRAEGNFPLKLAAREVNCMCQLTLSRLSSSSHSFSALKPWKGTSVSNIEVPKSGLKSCVGAIHELLDDFANFLEKCSAVELNSLPSLHFSRVAYAMISLLCIYFGLNSPKSKLKDLLSVEDIRINDYMTRFLAKLRSSAPDETRRPAQRFQLIVKMLKAWHDRMKDGGPRSPLRNEIANLDSLSAQPAEEEGRNTPRLGYRKLSVHGSKLSEDHTSSVPSTPGPQKSSNAQGPSRQSGNTPLDLLSHVATNAPSATNATNADWYGGQDHNNSYHPLLAESSYAGPDGNSLTTADPHSAAGIIIDPALEQAMGMAFGSEGEIYGSFLDDLFRSMQEGQQSESGSQD